MRKPKEVEELLAAGEEIERLRGELGFTEPFQPFSRYLAYRDMWSANSPSEPKLANEFLRQFGEEPR